MAIKSGKPSGDKARSFNRGTKRGGSQAGAGIAATFRPEVEKRQTQKTTMDFDKAVYRALKFHAVATDRPIRDLVEEYVRAGLTADGVSVDDS